MAEENDLLRRYAESGDEEAFAQFVALRAGFVYARALPRVGGDAHAARDASQLVFVAAARDAGRLATHPQLSGWLFTATRNACSTLVRAERRRKRRELQAGEGLIPGAAEEAREGAPDIELLLDLLGERERAAVILRYFDNLSYAAVGRALRISEEAARKCIERAVASLRRHLGRSGQTVSAVSIATILVARRAHALPVELSRSLAHAALATSHALRFPTATLLLHAMSQSKLIAAGLGIAALAFVAAGYRDHVQTAGLNLDSDVLQLRLRPSPSQAPGKSGPLLAASGARAKTPSPVASDDVRTAAAAWRAFSLERSRLARTDPECGALMVKMMTGALHEEYGRFYKQAALSADQISALEKAVSEEQLAEGDIVTSAASQGAAPSDPTTRILLDRAKDTLKTDLAGVLGDSGYQSFLDYQATVAQRDFVESVSGELWQARQPMSTDQFERVLSAVETDVDPNGVYGIAFTTTDWARLQAHVTGVLTPAQLPVWDAIVTEHKFSNAAVVQMNRH